MFALVTATALLLSHPAPAPGATLTVTVDSARHYVTLTSGKYDLPAGTGDSHSGMSGMSGMAGMSMVESKLMRFTFPVDGWLRGVKLKITDQNGKVLSRRFIHHINVVNFSRRQLFYPVPERIIALGQETEDVRLPATVGIPVNSTMPMALLIMFDNETKAEVKGVTVEMSIEYSPTNLVPRPLSVLPGYMDVVNPIAHDVDFDLPPGETSYHAEFKLQLPGRIIGVGGHAHDFATGLSLLDVTNGTPKTVVKLKTTLHSDGHLLAIERQLPGVTGAGIHLTQGHTYRLVGTYNNTTGKLLTKGAMLHMVMLFAPDKADQWPRVNPADNDWKRDVARLEANGGGTDDMKGMKMDH